jgi:uncharacterized phage-associated protein
MATVFDFAKYFIKFGHDTHGNTFDGNMKLQKLLVFANLISLAERNKLLFDDEILAFDQGCVIEEVRLRYRNDYPAFLQDSKNFDPNFSQEEHDVINLAISIFGKLSARELSNVNHSFEFWKKAHEHSIQESGFKDKTMAVVSLDAIKMEIDKIKDMIAAFREVQADNNVKEIINGIEFIYSPDDLDLTDEILDRLFAFSLNADEPSYVFYFDNDDLVIY